MVPPGMLLAWSGDISPCKTAAEAESIYFAAPAITNSGINKSTSAEAGLSLKGANTLIDGSPPLLKSQLFNLANKNAIAVKSMSALLKSILIKPP